MKEKILAKRLKEIIAKLEEEGMVNFSVHKSFDRDAVIALIGKELFDGMKVKEFIQFYQSID